MYTKLYILYTIMSHDNNWLRRHMFFLHFLVPWFPQGNVIKLTYIIWPPLNLLR